MKNKIVSFIMLMALVLIPSVKAESIYNANDKVKDEGEYFASRFIAGNKVESTSTVDGISFIAGESLSLSGASEYGFYAGNNITVDGSVFKDSFIAGNNITITADAYLGRDVFIAGNVVDIKSDIQRNLRAGGSIVDIKGVTINGNASIYADRIVMDEKTVINGKFMYNEDTEVIGLDVAKVKNIEKLKNASVVDVTVSEKTIMDYIYDFVFSVAASFVTLVLLFYIIPISKKKLDKIKIKPGKMLVVAGIGFVVLVFTPIAAIIAMFTRVLLPVGIIGLLLYGVCIYLSSLFVSYIVGKRIGSKVFKTDNEYCAIISGVVAFKLVTLIPVVGGIVKAISLFYGLGLAYKFIIKKKTKKSQATA